MPRKSIDASAASLGAELPANQAPRKTERSHEENQERAYIAASRRSDRSIEARVQSARMASDIHKKRTGKGFKISEEIVMKEEMYEEEDDELPRQFRSLTSHLATNSPVLASRLNAYVSTQVAMHSALAAREREIEKQFAEQFPAYQTSRSRTQSVYVPPFAAGPHPQTGPAASHFPQHRHSRDATMGQSQNPSSAPRHASPDGSVTPRSVSVQPDSPLLNQIQPYQSPPQYAMTNDFAYPVSAAPTTGSSKYFTAELPNEVKQMANLDWNDPMTPALYGVNLGAVDGGAPGNNPLSWDFLNTPTATAGVELSIPAKAPFAASPGDYFNEVHSASQHLALPGGQSTIGTPGGSVGGDPWDIWINSDSYGADISDKQ